MPTDCMKGVPDKSISLSERFTTETRVVRQKQILEFFTDVGWLMRDLS